jgi:hypothetical protein
MPYNLHIVQPSDFIRLDARGKPDLVESRRALEGIAKLCVERGTDCALLDVRNVKGNMSLTDLYTLAKTFNEMGFNEKHRLAVLHRYEAGERAEMFAMFASSRGWNVRAFENYEQAIEWFSTILPLDKSTRNEP